MRSISGLLSLIAIKFSNLKVSNSSRNASVIFMVSLILLSMISVSDLAGAQLVSSQDDSSTVTDTPRTNNNTINPKTECNEPIEINNVSSSSFDNTNNEDDDGVNAELAFDSDEGTEWSEDRVGAYLEFDIGAIRSICDIEIQWDKGEERSYNFVVSVSENGTKFKDRIRATSSGNSDLPELYSFPDTMAKQVRLTVYGNSEDETASIKEISVNGRDVRKIGQGYKICEELPVAKFVATPSQSGDPPEKAVDGDYTTAWSAEGAGSFLQADVGEVKSICHVSIAWYNGESRQYVFEVSVSKDGINFDQVYEGISSGNSIRPQYYAFSEADARYVRITVFGNDKDNWAGITELSIKGFTPPLPPNNPPVADPKSFSTDMNVPIPITLSGSDPEGSILTFNIVDLPKHGQLSSVSSDTVKYTPDKDYSGSDSFTYTVKDSKGLTSAKSTVSINIKEVLECRTLNPTVVTAIGSDGANVPSNVIDKNLNTGWSKDGTGSWIQFDLGSPAKICSVDIAWYRGDMRQNVFTISVSDDGSVFKKVFDGGSKGTATGFEKYNLPSGTEGKFVRITVNGNTENNWASITEIALFGVRSTSEPPSPPPSEPPSPPPSEPPSPPPSEPPSPPPTDTDFPYTFVGSPQDMEDEGWDERRYASGKPNDITHEWSGETSAQNYAIIIDITLTEIDHDDTISFKFGGTHMGSGWYDNTYSFESGQSCIGKEEDHPSTDLCVVTGKSIGNLVNTPVKLAAVNIGKGEKLEMYSNLGSGWTKDVESSNGVDGFRPQVEEDEAVIRIDGAPGIEMRSAQIVELDPASANITTAGPTNTLSPTPSDKMASTEDDGWTEGEYAGTLDEQKEQARQDWEGAGRPGDRYTGLPTP